MIFKETKMDDFVSIGIELLGHRIKIMREIAKLNHPAQSEGHSVLHNGFHDINHGETEAIC